MSDAARSYTHGDKVRPYGGGPIGKVVAVEGPKLVVEDGFGRQRTWAIAGVRPYPLQSGPRGVTRPTERMLEAARLLASGACTRPDIAERYDVSGETVDKWVEVVRDAAEDARRKALR